MSPDEKVFVSILLNGRLNGRSAGRLYYVAARRYSVAREEIFPMINCRSAERIATLLLIDHLRCQCDALFMILECFIGGPSGSFGLPAPFATRADGCIAAYLVMRHGTSEAVRRGLRWCGRGTGGSLYARLGRARFG
jgi:hypothetical protein